MVTKMTNQELGRINKMTRPTPQQFHNKCIDLWHGDCLDIVGFNLKENTFDAIVTDPPYALNFMGKKWDTHDIVQDSNTWLEFLQVLKPGGYLLAFAGTRTGHRMACA